MMLPRDEKKVSTLGTRSGKEALSLLRMYSKSRNLVDAADRDQHKSESLAQWG